METVQSIIIGVLALGFLIFFHELGHFSIARLFGMGVKTFSIGFGKTLWGTTRGDTEYKLSLIPLGGYVQLAGEDGSDEPDPRFPDSTLFSLRPAWQRLCVVAAGPIFNFVLAFLIFWFMLLNWGQPASLPVIGKVMKDTPAMAAGLQGGDKVIEVNGKKIKYWGKMVKIIRANKGEAINLVVQRGNDKLAVTLTPKMKSLTNIFGEEVSVPLIGIQSAGKVIMVPVEGIGLVAAVETTWLHSKMLVTGLMKMIQGVISPKNVGGVIFMFEAVHKGVQSGLEHLLFIVAIISINLGVVNLLPIPVLDGGHILYFTIEIIRGRPVNERARAIATRIGMMLLVALMIFATLNDLRRALS